MVECKRIFRAFRGVDEVNEREMPSDECTEFFSGSFAPDFRSRLLRFKWSRECECDDEVARCKSPSNLDLTEFERAK